MRITGLVLFIAMLAVGCGEPGETAHGPFILKLASGPSVKCDRLYLGARTIVCDHGWTTERFLNEEVLSRTRIAKDGS